jgi:adenosylcobinamide-GDP ribazoletransferase
MDAANGAHRGRAELRAIAAAFTFLTRLPAGRIAAHDSSDLPRAVGYFPLVGLCVGAVSGGAFAAAVTFWPPVLAAIVATSLSVWMTGAFHEDALADSLDGFGGGWDRAQVLTIMKDSRVGSYALVGTALVLAAKIAAVVAVFDNARGDGMSLLMSALAVGRAFVAGHVLARWSSVVLMWKYPYVRADTPGDPSARSSAGGAFANGADTARLTFASILTLACVLAAEGRGAVVPGAVAIAVTWIGGRYFKRRIGGITGDALGAANQFVELCVYLALAARLTGR